ncbi:MAG: ribosome small subunit-dependent GTPase A [Chloroflexi bacterium]|nr:ribosome small subunit-dependent GTPase A [Chloroflexota bacterium]
MMILFTVYGGFTTVASREEQASKEYEQTKTIRKVRKQIKRNRKPDRVRSKDWLPDNFTDLESLEEIDTPVKEPVMPRGERERRQSAVAAALADLAKEAGISGEFSLDAEDLGLQGTVIEVSSGMCRVDLPDRQLLCGLRSSLTAEDTGYTNVIAVGDRVVISSDGSERGFVEVVLPRKSVLARTDVHTKHLQQVIVANADQVLIVASWRNPPIWLELIDRYLISAARNNLSPIICINKVDLAEDKKSCTDALKPYIDHGYRVVFTSAVTNEGVDELRRLMRSQITVLAGVSGVGKSSLLTAVQPDLNLRTASVSEFSGDGRHTTTQVSLWSLEMGGFAIDTPGIREFGLAGLSRSELAVFYPEMANLGQGCRFSDCSHVHEPDCAVKLAVDQGSIAEGRYHSYKKIFYSLPA